MIIVLTEKPSVAKDFARALNCIFKGGVFKSSKYIILNAIGHLVHLAVPEKYNPNWKKWSLEDLPIIPSEFKHLSTPKTEKQLALIKKTINETDYEKIIIATDAGREGELIARLILKHCGVKDWGKVFRFWSSEALTPEVIFSGLERIEPIIMKKYDDLYSAGINRQLSDWLIGINLSRLLSLKLNGAFSVGRVQSAVLGIILRRQEERKFFKTKDYFQFEGIFIKEGQEFKGLYTHENKNNFDSKAPLFDLEEQLRNQADNIGIVKKVESKRVVKAAPLLYNLTALQKDANSSFGYTAKKTLDITQQLYEVHKCVSYPRTPSRVLGESNISLVRGIVEKLEKVYSEIFIFQDYSRTKITSENKRLFDDQRLEDHHALLPLAPIPEEKTSEEEKKIYGLILASFSAALAPPYVYLSFKIFLLVRGYSFVATGRNIQELGWRKIIVDIKDENDNDIQKQNLPLLEEEEKVSLTAFNILSKKTKPKPAYNDASILAVMENPEKHSSFDEKDLNYHFEKGSGIGTQATRANILETLLTRGYLMREGKRLAVTEKGIHFVHSAEKIPALAKVIDVSETARWETELKENPERFYDATVIELEKIVANVKRSELAVYIDEKKTFGVCPKCAKGRIYEGKKSYYCSRYKDEDGCNFTLWKTTFGITLAKKDVGLLLEGKRTKNLKLYRKDGSDFNAALTLNADYKITFASR